MRSIRMFLVPVRQCSRRLEKRREANPLRIIFALIAAWALCFMATSYGQEALFSGPQVGESLKPFTVRGVLDADAGKDLDFITLADAKPIVLIFVHDVNRQSISLTRILSNYTRSRAKDGLFTGVILLDDDATKAEETIKRIRHALTDGVRTGVSVDGREGPGSYGLNRNVTLTILVGKENKVTANFALVQPSLQVDLPKILQNIVDVVGGEVPKLEELEGMRENMRQQPNEGSAPNLRPLLAPLIKQGATDEAVDVAAKAVEERCAKDEAARREVGRIANTIIDAGKLENYGTAKAQEYLKKWAKEFGKPKDEKSDDKTKESAARSNKDRER
jgi:hypothetical protein